MQAQRDHQWLLGAQTPAQVLYARSLKAGIHGLNHATDAAILTSAWSAGSAFLYSGSRALYSMSLGGQPPKLFSHTNKLIVP